MSLLKENGISNPVTIERENYIKAAITTGLVNGENKMPVQLKYVKTEDKNGDAIVPVRTIMFGMVKG